MNDRFKFRIYDKGNEQYLDPEDMDCVCHLPNGCFTIATWDGIQGDMKYWADEDIVVEMSTGLKDKNGNLIYEGDLIKSPNNSYPLEIVRMPNGVYGCKVCKISPVWEMNLYSLINAYDVEIIGNIHEQAEQKDK